MNKTTHIDVAVIGCGIFGAEIAIKLKSLGLSVNVYEAKEDILSGASANNQNRLHLGFHYPRDMETARQSIRGFADFKNKYYECIQDDFLNAYFISNEKSLTTVNEYIKFCDLLGEPYKKISPESFPFKILGSNFGILCNEVVYDCSILKRILRESLRINSVQVELNQRVTKIEKIKDKFLLTFNNKPQICADVVINASYSDINRLTAQLGYKVNEKLYEYTAVPIIQIDNIPKIGVTIMDGPFMTLLPYGKSDHFLLYSVEHSVIAQNVDVQINSDWLSSDTAPFSRVDKHSFFEKMISFSREFIPILETAKIKGFLESSRMVMANSDHNDRRPSMVTDYDGAYYTVMAGKIDHCIWVAEEISLKLQTNLQ